MVKSKQTSEPLPTNGQIQSLTNYDANLNDPGFGQVLSMSKPINADGTTRVTVNGGYGSQKGDIHQ